MILFSILLFLFRNLRTGSLCKVGFTTFNCLNSRVFLNLFLFCLDGGALQESIMVKLILEKWWSSLVSTMFSRTELLLYRQGIISLVKGSFQPIVTAIFNDQTEGWNQIGIIFSQLDPGLVSTHDFEKYWWKQMVGSNRIFGSSFSGKLSCIFSSVFVVFIVRNSDQKYKIFSNQ